MEEISISLQWIFYKPISTPEKKPKKTREKNPEIKLWRAHNAWQHPQTPNSNGDRERSRWTVCSTCSTDCLTPPSETYIEMETVKSATMNAFYPHAGQRHILLGPCGRQEITQRTLQPARHLLAGNQSAFDERTVRSPNLFLIHTRGNLSVVDRQVSWPNRRTTRCMHNFYTKSGKRICCQVQAIKHLVYEFSRKKYAAHATLYSDENSKNVITFQILWHLLETHWAVANHTIKRKRAL